MRIVSTFLYYRKYRFLIKIYKNISKSQWVQEYGNMLNEIIGDRFVPRDVVIIDLNVHEE